jgi:hypothetical protein
MPPPLLLLFASAVSLLAGKIDGQRSFTAIFNGCIVSHISTHLLKSLVQLIYLRTYTMCIKDMS